MIAAMLSCKSGVRCRDGQWYPTRRLPAAAVIFWCFGALLWSPLAALSQQQVIYEVEHLRMVSRMTLTTKNFNV